MVFGFLKIAQKFRFRRVGNVVVGMYMDDCRMNVVMYGSNILGNTRAH
jgi:hypothetical protein